jgi:monofunctional biosynthetic peptidoglycan transglycosylase
VFLAGRNLKRIRSLFYRSHRGYLGKERIMEVYLNSIEMGMVYTGAQAASEHWYRKESYSIQAAGIAAILPNPRKYTATSSLLISIIESKIMRVMRTVGKIQY